MPELTPYALVRRFAGRGDRPDQFTSGVRDLLCRDDELYVAGDQCVKVFDRSGAVRRIWDTCAPAYCLTIGPDERILVGEAEALQIFTLIGTQTARWNDPGRFGLITAIAINKTDMFIADAHAKMVRRYDHGGNWKADIGVNNKPRGFLIPNGSLDLALAADGMLLVTNPGKHRIERYSPDGTLLDHFGRFDGIDPAGFGGCCNPVAFALTADGSIAVTEKAPPRAKIYGPDRTLRAVMGERDMNAMCRNNPVALDDHGRVFVADSVTCEILVFAPTGAAA